MLIRGYKQTSALAGSSCRFMCNSFSDHLHDGHQWSYTLRTVSNALRTGIRLLPLSEPPTSPLAPAPTNPISPLPCHLRAKIHCRLIERMLTTFISTDITFESLKDRIDAKILQYTSDYTLSSGYVELKLTVDGDYVPIVPNGDVQVVFEI